MELDQQIADVRLVDELRELVAHRLGAADDDRAHVVDVLPVLGVAEQLVGGVGVLEIGLVALRAEAAGRHREAAAGAAQMALEAVPREIEDRLLALGARDLIGLGDVYAEKQAEPARMERAADLADDLLEAPRRADDAAELGAGRDEIAKAAPRHLEHRLLAVGARHPDRRMRRLQGLRPRVHVAHLVVAAVERRRAGPGPRLDDEVDALPEALAGECWRIGIAEWLLAATGGEAGNDPAAGHAVEHRVFLGDAQRTEVQRHEIAEHDDLAVLHALSEGTGDDIGRRHQAVDVLVVLVEYDTVEAQLVGLRKLVDVFLEQAAGLVAVELRVGDRDPAALVVLLEALVQMGPRHEVPGEDLGAVGCGGGG